MPPRLLFDHFGAYQRTFLARSLAFSRTLNTRNIEAYWYIIWNHILLALVSGLPHLLVAPQYHLWCVDDGTDTGNVEELAPAGDEDEILDVGPIVGTDDDGTVNEDWKEPESGFDLFTFNKEPPKPAEPEYDWYSEEDPSLNPTLAQSKATSQIADFAIVQVVPRPGTDVSTSSPLGRVFDALTKGTKALTALMKDLLRSRAAKLPVAQQLPRVLVEIKRYIPRQAVPDSELFKSRLSRKLTEAQEQLLHQAAILFCMPEASADVVILVAAAGPYYTTAHVRRKRKVRAGFVHAALESKDMESLKETLIAPRWTKPLYLGTEASNARLAKLKTRIANWGAFEKEVNKK
ncbi:hypothetical protein C8R43DRAFT_954961 [Mycena crocata]|nr:hypothetical protein C8R43DRAFT_954961 [Mycena crocata]